MKNWSANGGTHWETLVTKTYLKTTVNLAACSKGYEFISVPDNTCIKE